MKKSHDVVFSDMVANLLGGKLLASSEVGEDEQGKVIVTADLGPLEVSLYTSHTDGALVVQIDSPTLTTSEHPTLRVYLNDTTLYDSNSELEEPAETDLGEEHDRH